MFSNSRRKKCWCRHQRWFQHARVSAHKYFDDGADCSALCGRVCAWGQHRKFKRSSSSLSLKYMYFILCSLLPSCHIYKYDGIIHFLEKVELLLQKSYCCFSTLNFRWNLLALNIEMRASSDSAKTILVSERCAHLKYELITDACVSMRLSLPIWSGLHGFNSCYPPARSVLRAFHQAVCLPASIEISIKLLVWLLHWSLTPTSAMIFCLSCSESVQGPACILTYTQTDATSMLYTHEISIV